MSIVHRTVAGLATAALCVSLAACSGGSGGGATIATVNGTNITKAEFDAKLEASPAGKQTLSQLIQQALVEQYAKDKGLTASDDEIKKQEDDIRAKYPPGQFDQILKSQGLTEDDVHKILREQVLIQKAVDPQVKVTDADIKAYFDKNHAMMDKPEQVRARHILVADKKTADEVEAKLKAGGKFEDLAKQYSTDPSTKDKGGELGFFGKGQMVPAFQDAAFAAKVGEITAPVKSPFGWHIIQVEEKKPAVKATLASMHDTIRDQLKQQQIQQLAGPFLNNLRNSAKISVTDPRFADVVPSPLPSAPAAAPAPAPTK
jgi:foldase protein PrsA